MAGAADWPQVAAYLASERAVAEERVPSVQTISPEAMFRLPPTRRGALRYAESAPPRQARASGSAAGKWWLTPVSLDTCCARCGGMLRRGMDMVYRARPREALCESCASRDPEVRRSSRPSVRWEREQSRRRETRRENGR